MKLQNVYSLLQTKRVDPTELKFAIFLCQIDCLPCQGDTGVFYKPIKTGFRM